MELLVTREVRSGAREGSWLSAVKDGSKVLARSRWWRARKVLLLEGVLGVEGVGAAAMVSSGFERRERECNPSSSPFVAKFN